jgi:hypothetical protein
MTGSEFCVTVSKEERIKLSPDNSEDEMTMNPQF